MLFGQPAMVEFPGLNSTMQGRRAGYLASDSLVLEIRGH
jgi:hypothetical protein